MTGRDSDLLPYPEYIAERIKAWVDESGHGPVFGEIKDRITRRREAVEYGLQDPEIVYRFVPRPDKASDWELEA